MVFISICRALYDYVPQGDNELAIEEGELLYILEKSSEDDWWKAKKKPPGEDEDEPMGLIPNNYVQEVSVSYLPVYSTNPTSFLSISMLLRTSKLIRGPYRLLHPTMPKHYTTTQDKLMRSFRSPKIHSCQSMIRQIRTGR